LKQSELDRWVAKVDFSGECWEWTGARNPKSGYSSFWYRGNQVTGHQFINGRAPEGMEWDHLCMNRGCVYPEHLEAVPPRVNMRRMMAAKKEQAA
jgi:hypothetical protein